MSHCAFSLSLSLSVGCFPSCAFNLLCSYPAFMKCAVRFRRAKSRAGCRCRFLGRSLCAFGAMPPQPLIATPSRKGTCCSRTATCLPTDLGHLSHVALDAGGLIRVTARPSFNMFIRTILSFITTTLFESAKIPRMSRIDDC